MGFSPVCCDAVQPRRDLEVVKEIITAAATGVLSLVAVRTDERATSVAGTFRDRYGDRGGEGAAITICAY
jgi:hypothetical protein